MVKINIVQRNFNNDVCNLCQEFDCKKNTIEQAACAILIIWNNLRLPFK